ncbi:MAG: DMT family transporter [Pseudomonadota bacterium]
MARTHRPQFSISGRAWALLFLLALIWGGSFLSNRIALAEVGVLTTVAFRVAGAAVLLWVYVIWRGLPVPRAPRQVAGYVAMGVFNNVIPFSLIVWGQQHIPSGLAAILNSATSVFGILIVAAFFPDERLTARKLTGVLIGFAGVAIAIGADNLRAFDLASLGQIAVLAAAASYAISGVIGRKTMTGIRPEVAAAGMLTASSLVMVPAAALAEGMPSLAYAPQTWAALLYLASTASALAYMIYYAILRIAGAGNLGLVTLLVAPVAIVLGALVYREALSPADYMGFATLAAGLLVIDGRLGGKPRTAALQDSA